MNCQLCPCSRHPVTPSPLLPSRALLHPIICGQQSLGQTWCCHREHGAGKYKGAAGPPPAVWYLVTADCSDCCRRLLSPPQPHPQPLHLKQPHLGNTEIWTRSEGMPNSRQGATGKHQYVPQARPAGGRRQTIMPRAVCLSVSARRLLCYTRAAPALCTERAKMHTHPVVAVDPSAEPPPLPPVLDGGSNKNLKPTQPHSDWGRTTTMTMMAMMPRMTRATMTARTTARR